MRYSVSQPTEFTGLLGEIPSKPKQLRVCGNAQLLDYRPALGIVGTRKPSVDARQLAFELARAAAESSWLVVSGLALGIDGAAHSGAMEAGQTAAFLGCGLAEISPKSHRPLAARILETGGFLASEVEDNTSARPQHLIARNRLISGLSVATVVISSGANGGTMHTARFAVQQQRPIFCPRDLQIGDEGGKLLLECPQNELKQHCRAFASAKLTSEAPLAEPFDSPQHLLEILSQKKT